jgi:hypothetical protein
MQYHRRRNARRQKVGIAMQALSLVAPVDRTFAVMPKSVALSNILDRICSTLELRRSALSLSTD